MRNSIVLAIFFFVLFARAEPGYTNHVGNVVAGWPVKLTATQVTLSECAATNHQPLTTSHYLPSLDLPRTGTAAHRGGLRPPASAFAELRHDKWRRLAGDGSPHRRTSWTIARAGGREAGDHRGGEGSLHEGGERGVLRKVRGRAQELSRQAGRVGCNHLGRAKGARPMRLCNLSLLWRAVPGAVIAHSHAEALAEKFLGMILAAESATNAHHRNWIVRGHE